MKLQVNKRESRFVILLGVVLGIFLLTTYVIDPLLESQDEIRQELVTKIGFLEKIQKKVSNIDRLEKEISELGKYIEIADKRMLPGEKPSLAAAELQKLLKQIAGSVNVSIRQEKIVQSVSLGQYEQIPVQVTFISNTNSLKEILYQIENHSRLLLIPVMKVKVTSTRNPKEIETTLVVAGLISSKQE